MTPLNLSVLPPFSPRIWFFPVHGGDFRLERTDDPAVCRLSVEDPTARDRKKLEPFFAALVEKGVLPVAPIVNAWGKTEIVVPGTMADVGPLLAGTSHGIAAALWTAIRGGRGKTVVVDSVPAVLPSDIAVEGVVAAATVKPPQKGCPAPTACERRAAEVLRAFSTKSQWAQFLSEGRMRVVGSHTGRAYFVHHRDEAAYRGLSRVLSVARTGEAVCTYDLTVPPEEEVLSIKFAVEHREPWLLGLPG